MKRHEVLVVLVVVCLAGAIAQAQSLILSPQDGQRALDRIKQAQEDVQRLDNAARELERYYNLQNRWAVPGQRSGGPAAQGPVWFQRSTVGAWWTNTALITRLGITDEQKARIERAFENHRQSLTSSTEQLEKEEAQLARLLEAESIDRNAVHAQIDRVVQARSEMERTNSAMTLEMREQLTRAQWMQLQASQPNLGTIRIRTPSGDQLAPPAPPSPPPPGTRGRGRGGPPQQQ